MPDHHGTSTAAAAWLLAEFDAADLDDIIQNSHGDSRTLVIQPMFRLKSMTAPACAMRVTELDYEDPDRRWL